MKKLGGAIVAEALSDSNIHLVYGIPGTHNIELYDALLEYGEILPVLVGDEQAAGFMADGGFRASGTMAALNLVPGAGLTHALSGIAEAYLDQIPMLVLMCGIRQDTGAAYQLHDIDQAAIARPVVKRIFQPRKHGELYGAVREAAALAMTPPYGPVAVEVPADLYITRGEAERGSPAAEAGPIGPENSALEEVAARLNGSPRVGLYVGLGALPAAADLPALAEVLGAPVFTTVSGKGVFPEDHPLWAWNMIGRAAPAPFREIQQGLDCVLAIGCRFGEVATGSYGVDNPACLIHVDVDASVFNRNLKADIAVRSDSGEFVSALLESGRLHPRDSSEVEHRVARAHAAVSREQGAAPAAEGRVAPAGFFAALQRVAGPECVYVTDSGNGTFLAMEHLRISRPRSFLAPVDYSCMGYSAPAAIGAGLSAPGRPVAALCGDGAFMMTGFEVATAAAYRAGVVFFLLRDGELSQIAQFQRQSLNRESNTRVSEYGAESLAAGLGAGFVAVRPECVEEDVREAFRRASEGRPVVAEVPIDYSGSSYFSKGVVKTNFLRFAWKDRFRLVGRVVARKTLG